MGNPASIRAVIARPEGRGWQGRLVHGFGAPPDFGPIVHRLAREANLEGPDGVKALAARLIDEHYGWNRLAPDGQSLGDCRCHDPEPAAPSWPDGELLSPGRSATARYLYLLGPTGLGVQVHIDGDWRRLGIAAYTRRTERVRFDLMVTRAMDLQEAVAWDTDPLN